MYYLIEVVKVFLKVVNAFFLIYLIGYSTYLFLSSIIGSLTLYKDKKLRDMHAKLKDDYEIPLSILVPAHNEDVTILDTIKSLLELDYKDYEIIIIDDGSTDDTSNKIIEKYNLVKVRKYVNHKLNFKKVNEVYDSIDKNITLIKKENGGKADSLNAGIAYSNNPYFVTIDADSILQKDALKNIIRPILFDDRVIACGGVIRLSNGLKFKNGEIIEYRLPKGILASMQVLEYDRSFLASRILFDRFNGNLIISGAFGLFKKDIVIEAGGYDSNTVGEDFELVTKLHVFCKLNYIDYSIKYVQDAICWTQAPSNIVNLIHQRRRWNKGLIQVMHKYNDLWNIKKYGLSTFTSYLYFLIYELYSPFIELFGIITMILSFILDLLNVKFMLMFMLIYIIYSSILSLSIFFSRVHVANIKLKFVDLIKAITLSTLEITFLRFIILFSRLSAFINYDKHKTEWDEVNRFENNYE